MDHVQSLLAKPRNQTGRQITQPSNNQSPHCHALCEGEVAGSRSRADAKIVHKNEDRALGDGHEMPQRQRFRDLGVLGDTVHAR